MASQPTISRFLSHLTNEDIDELQELNRRIVSLIDERSANTVSQKTLNQKNTLKLCQRTGSFKVIYCILLI